MDGPLVALDNIFLQQIDCVVLPKELLRSYASISFTFQSLFEKSMFGQRFEIIQA